MLYCLWLLVDQLEYNKPWSMDHGQNVFRKLIVKFIHQMVMSQ